MVFGVKDLRILPEGLKHLSWVSLLTILCFTIILKAFSRKKFGLKKRRRDSLIIGSEFEQIKELLFSRNLQKIVGFLMIASEVEVNSNSLNNRSVNLKSDTIQDLINLGNLLILSELDLIQKQSFRCVL